MVYSAIDNVPEYKFTMNENYPFVPPKIYYKNTPFYTFIQMPTQRFQNTLKQLTNKDCLCCDSFCRMSNWSPEITMTYIIREINNIRKLKKNIILKILIHQITSKYLIDDVDISSYVF